MDRLAHDLVVAAQQGGEFSGVLPPRTGEQDLAATLDEGIGRP
jgi:hypothetical protein